MGQSVPGHDGRRERGRQAEIAAARYVQERGYTILATNVVRGRWELDIVARLDDTLVFVEVRSRSTERFGCPSESVNHRKQLHVARAAVLWLGARPLPPSIRFDVIAVVWESGRPVCRHFTDAFPSPL